MDRGSYAAETFDISNFKSNNDYVARLFKLVFHIILFFPDAKELRIISQRRCLSNYVKLRQVYTRITSTCIGLICYEKRSYRCATTSLNAVKIACKLAMLGTLARFPCVNSTKTALNQTSTCKAKHFFLKFYENQNPDFYGLLKDGDNSILLSSTKRLLN